jgi:cold shock CspA family protein
MTEEKDIGKVLWFDHRKGWGFVKIIKSFNGFDDKDVFVHYSSINCKNKFKKIFPGEYISLCVTKNDQELNDPKKEFVCNDITGLYGHPLLIDNEDYNYKVFNKHRDHDSQE